MKNNPYDFSNLAQPKNIIGQFADYFNSPAYITDTLIESGMRPEDARMQVAEYSLKQSQAAKHNYEVEMEKRKAMQEELMQQRLGELGIQDPSNIQGNFETLIQAGVEPNKAATIATQLAEMPFKREMQNEKMQGEMQQEAYKKQTTEQKRIADQEEGLRKEYNAISKPFQEVSRAYSKITKALTRPDPSAADDMASVYALIKLFDPTTGVRESEYAKAEDLKGVPEWMRSAYNKAATGELLTPEIRQRLYRTAKDLYGAEKGANQKIKSQYKAISERAGINPDNVLLDYNAQEDEEEFTPEQKERARWEQLKAIKERRGF